MKIAFLFVPEETNVERFARSYFCKYTTTVVLAPSCQAPTCERRSAPVETRERKIQEEAINQISPTQNKNEFPLIPKNGQGAEQVFERSLNRKKRKMGTSNSTRKFVTFNGLPIEPPLITVDLSNQIMNHTTPNDFIEFSSCGSNV